MGLVSLGRVAIDGTRMKANTSRAKAMSYERMQKAVAQISAELDALRADLSKANAKERTEAKIPKEIVLREKRLAKIKAAKAALEKEAGADEVDPKKQKSFADHDALPMFKAKDGFMYGYNCQAAVDGDHQIIVAAEVHDNVADSGALPSVLDAVKATTGQHPSEVLADKGYKSGANLEAIASRGAVAVIALGKGEQEGSGPDHLKDLRFHAKGSGHYRCQRNKVLAMAYTKQSGHTGLTLPKSHCRGCPFASRCGLYAKRGKTFQIPPETQRRLYKDLVRRMHSEAGRASYRRRKAIVEPVFGNIKNKKLKIGARGAAKVACWWKIAATAHNIEKIVGVRRTTATKQ